MWKFCKAVILVTVLTLVIAAFFVYKEYRKIVATIPYPQGQKIISITEGMTLNQAIKIIAQTSDIKEIWPYILYFKIHPELAKIQAGDYLVAENMTVLSILKEMRNGAVVFYQFTLIEGSTFRDLMDDLNKSEHIEHTLTDKTPDEIAKLVGIDGNPEGWFFPQTYNFSAGTTDLRVLKRLHKAMEVKLKDIWQNRDSDIAIKTPYEALIMASIIEKESGLVDEGSKISGVFDRRLKKGMRLQTDPTVMYGADQSTSSLTRSQLRKDTPYNTYTRYGLPPTPIAMPSEMALFAAVHPDNSDNLFFVANGKGGHTFSTNYKNHLKAVKAYRKKR